MFSMLLETIRRRQLLPPMSATERAALEAGDVWIEGEIFRGRPDFRRLLAEPYPRLSEAEQAFLDGPVAEACERTDPEEVARLGDLPPKVWAYLREERFFGLGLPEAYGGRALSALAMSAVFAKLASRSLTLSTVVVIPNSVGPGEFLLKVGTPEQREHYLPRLARGEEIPCFALTEPEAGSDAAALRSRGELCRGGGGELRIRLDFEKRYITLAPVATLIGLAIRLYDPDRLLGRGEDLGITCVLVPASAPGVEIGRRHDPLGLAFPNGPIRGRGVELAAEQILGGPEQAGRGWRMLMEALSGGRAISLPAQAVAGARHVARVAGAYARVRRQFGMPIGRFEGIEEPLARIAGSTYLMEAARAFACGAVDRGHRPAVASALLKVNLTELARELARDGMDILGGAGICRGPRNLMAEAFVGSPIGITVEGANILTRTLIVFGQGVIRCHPNAHRLMEAVRQGNVPAFRRALLSQLWHGLRTAGRAARLSASRGRLVRSPVGGPTARHYRRLAWAATRFALLADLALLRLGGGLKRRGKLAGRFADMLSWIYLGLATLRRFEAEGRRPEDLPLVDWASEQSLARVQAAYEGLLANFCGGPLGALLRGPCLWWARLSPMGRGPSDRQGAAAARVLLRPGRERERLLAGAYLPADAEHPLRVLERAFRLAAETEGALARLRRAGKGAEEALAEGLITEEERDLLARAEAARREATRVDSFPPEALSTARPTDPALRSA